MRSCQIFSTSLSVAVPVAALYMHHMHRAKQIASFQRTGGRYRSTAISIPKKSGLMFEMKKWLEVRKELNGASWYRAELPELYSYPYAARGKHTGRSARS